MQSDCLLDRRDNLMIHRGGPAFNHVDKGSWIPIGKIKAGQDSQEFPKALREAVLHMVEEKLDGVCVVI